MNLNATILGQTISFILFVCFCMKYVWLPLLSIIENRRKKISDSLETIKRSTIESELANKEALACLQKARIQAQEIVKHAYECKTKILHEAKDEANKEKSKILSRAQEEIYQEKKRVNEELRKKIGRLVMESAEKIIEKSIDDTIDHDVINKIIEILPYED